MLPLPNKTSNASLTDKKKRLPSLTHDNELCTTRINQTLQLYITILHHYKLYYSHYHHVNNSSHHHHNSPTPSGLLKGTTHHRTVGTDCRTSHLPGQCSRLPLSSPSLLLLLLSGDFPHTQGCCYWWWWCGQAEGREHLTAITFLAPYLTCGADNYHFWRLGT